MTLKTIAAEGKSAALQRDAGRASIFKYCSINFKPILLCDVQAKTC